MTPNMASLNLEGWPGAYLAALVLSMALVTIVFLVVMWYRGVMGRENAVVMISIALFLSAIYLWLEVKT